MVPRQIIDEIVDELTLGLAEHAASAVAAALVAIGVLLVLVLDGQAVELDFFGERRVGDRVRPGRRVGAGHVHHLVFRHREFSIHLFDVAILLLEHQAEHVAVRQSGVTGEHVKVIVEVVQVAERVDVHGAKLLNARCSALFIPTD